MPSDSTNRTPEPAPGQSLPVGTRIEEFTIERVLGSGGFGITYLAEDARLGRKVVVKENLPVQFAYRESRTLRVRPRDSEGEDAELFAWSLESFEREAAMLASLDHPGIVRVLRSFEANGTAYFAMPYVEGASLEEEMDTRRGKTGGFGREEVEALLLWLLEALDYLHLRGIYHRDIKPGNVLITAEGEGAPVLIDFGAARQRLSERSLTVIESPGYTPFEQLQSRGAVGPWSDLYALGATVFKMLTGEAPPKAADRVLEDPFEPLAGRADLVARYGAGLLETVDRALAVKAGDRWQEAGEWRKALGGGEATDGADASDASSKREVSSAPVHAAAAAGESGVGRRKALGAVAVAGVLGVAALGLGAWLLSTSGSGKLWMEMNPSIKGSRAGEVREFGGIEMVWCPPGEFLMGSPEGEEGRLDNERQHRVTLTKGFWLAKTECMQGQWESVMGNNPSHFKGENLPVDSVSWNDVQGWLVKMNERHPLPEGWEWDLPTEAQWEYACRAGTTGAYGGTGILREMGWYHSHGGGETHPVGGKAANAWGLHDMHGNVWEWCRDWYGEYPTGAVTDPNGPESGTVRVCRGGSWASLAQSCRSANRRVGASDFRNYSFGFRPALVPSISQ